MIFIAVVSTVIRAITFPEQRDAITIVTYERIIWAHYAYTHEVYMWLW